jgi:hypothetical protein
MFIYNGIILSYKAIIEFSSETMEARESGRFFKC